jgi:hypothetical protein
MYGTCNTLKIVVSGYLKFFNVFWLNWNRTIMGEDY